MQPGTSADAAIDNRLAVITLQQVQQSSALEKRPQTDASPGPTEKPIDSSGALKNFAYQALDDLLGPKQRDRLKELKDRNEELVELLKQYLQCGNAEEALQLGGRLAQSWWMNGLQKEMHPLMEDVMSLLSQGSDDARARAMAGMGSLKYALGQFDRARESYERAMPLLESAGNLPLLAHVLDRAGMAARQQCNFDDASGFHKRALNVFRKLPGTEAHRALCLNNLGVVELHRDGDLDAAHAYHSEALDLRRKSGDVRGIASSLNNLAQVDRFKGRLDETIPRMEEALKLRTSIQDTWGVAGSHMNLAAVKASMARASLADDAASKPAVDLIDAAAEHLREAVAGFRKVGDTKLGFSESLESAADLAMARGAHADAVELLACAQKRRDQFDTPRYPLLERTVSVHLTELRAQLGDSVFEEVLLNATDGESNLRRIDGTIS
jgi:tetratricopeptide (TPR) repeat protein